MSATTEAPVRRAPLAGYAYAVAIVFIWAGFSLMGRHAALGSGVRLTPWDLGALRHLVSGVAAVLLVLGGVGWGLTVWRSFVLGTVAGVLFPMPAFLGLTFAPAAHAAVILSGTLPFMVALGTWALYGERWTRSRVISLVVLLAGICLLGFEAYVQGNRPGAWRGDLLFLFSAADWAVYTILARQWRATPAQAIVSVGLWSAGLYLPVWWLLLPSTIGAAPASEIALQAVFQGAIATLLSLYVFTRALALIGPVRLTTISALVPGLAGLLAIPLLGEDMGPVALLGLALVCVAVALGVRR